MGLKLNLKLLLIGLLGIFFLGTIGNSHASCDAQDRKLIFRHDVSNSAIFVNDAEAKQINENVTDPTSVDKYSRLFDLERYRDPDDGKFEFKLVYPGKNITNHWKQTTNPVTATVRGVAGYEAISVDYAGAGRIGLNREPTSPTFIDGVGTTTRWFAIGAFNTYQSATTIPGPGQIISLVELYVCSDKLAPINTFTANTPADNFFTSQNSFTIESTIVEENLKQANIVYDDINYNIYDNNIFLNLNFDNLSSLGETAGSIVKSSVGDNLEGTVNGADWIEINEGNGAYEFNDNSDYIRINDNDDLDIDGDYTISLRDYYDTSLMTGRYHTLFNRRGQKSDEGFLWSWFNASPSNNNLYFQYANGTSIATTSFSNIKNPNTRQHITYTYNHDINELKLYVNGESKGTKTLTNYLLPQTDNLYIGSYRGVTNYSFIGKIDEFKIYNYTLGGGEIEDIYNRELNKDYKSWHEQQTFDTYKFTLVKELTDGIHNYSIISTDLQLNTGSTENRIITKDSTLPAGNIEYSDTTSTNQSVVATLSGSEPIIITNNGGSADYTFTGNGSFTFEFEDLAGNTGSEIATVTWIHEEVPIEQFYNNPELVLPSQIQNYIKVFSDGINPDRNCINKTLKVDLGYSGTYLVIPAWTCYIMSGGTTNDLNLYNTLIQKTSNERYKFLFGKTAIKTFFDKPIKFVFNKNMFSGAVVGSLSMEPNLYIKHIGTIDYISDSISHSYYVNCINGISDISNSQLIHYDDAYIGYTCEGGDFKVGFSTDSSSSSNTGSTNTGATAIYNTYNTYNTYNNSSSSKKYYTDGPEDNVDSDLLDENKQIEVPDELITKSTSDVINEINKIAVKKGIAIDQDLLVTYIYGRKNYIITYPYYSEDYLLKNVDKKTLAIMLSRYAKQIAHLSEINFDSVCKFNDINNLDRSTQNYIISACKYGLFSPDESGKFNPNEIIQRNEFANSLIRMLGEDIHGSADNNITILKEKGILTIIDNRNETKQTVLIAIKRMAELNKNANLGYDSISYTFNNLYKVGYKGVGVRKLQEFLVNYGTLKEKATGYFGPKTLEALYQFQLNEKILNEDSPISLRGYMGPSTREAINEMIK